MNTSKVSFLLFIVSMILISHSLTAASGESLYEGVCRETKNPDCIPLLKDDPQITSAKNYLDLSRFILDFAEKKAREGKEGAKGDLIKDPESAAYQARVAGDGPEYCAKAFKEANIENPPINKLVASVSTIAFYAINHLH
ncbi:unnamed protein product [Lupinus luteus]|uniref:Pectinesterase inhibitor domain-containing protein n=1 Tax=Lupinus luteus TaxID=3873 RepID=A0AAV1Y2H3_LUPLU